MIRFRNILVLVWLSRTICQQLIHHPQNKGCHVYKVTTNVIVDPEMCLKNINKISTTQCVQKCSEMEEVIPESYYNTFLTLRSYVVDYIAVCIF